MKLESKRLILRNLKKSDEKELQVISNNVKIAKWIPGFPYPYMSKDAKILINKCLRESKIKLRENYRFCIVLKSNNKLIGMINLIKIDRF